MIVTSERSEVQGTTPRVRYRVEVPATNPLMPSAPVSLVKEKEGISLKWDGTEAVDAEGIGQKLVSELLIRSREHVQRYPRSARAHTNLGLAYMNAGQLSDAVAMFQRALELDPTNYVAGTNLAKVFTWQGKFSEAEEIRSEERRVGKECRS